MNAATKSYALIVAERVEESFLGGISDGLCTVVFFTHRRFTQGGKLIFPIGISNYYASPGKI